MDSVATGLVLIPGAVALLVFFVFTYLYEQNRHNYFRAWQLAWAAYTLYYGLKAIEHFYGASPLLFLLSSLLLVAMAICIFVSTRLMKEPFELKWYDIALTVAGVLLAYISLRAHMAGRVFRETATPVPIYLRMEIGLAATLLYCSFHFYRYGFRRNSVAFRTLAFALALWAALMGAGQLSHPFVNVVGQLGGFLAPIPQMLLALAMVMVLFENERNAVQENALAFSTLGVDPRRLLSASDLVPSLQAFVERLVAPLPSRRAVFFVSQQWRGTVPSVQKGFSAEFLEKLQKTQAGDYIAELAYRRGGVVTFRNLRELEEPLPALSGGKVRGLQADPAGGGNHGPDGSEPANAGAQLRGAFVSARGAAHVRLFEFAAADRAGSTDRADAGKLCSDARSAAPHQGIRTAHRDRAGHQFSSQPGRSAAHGAGGTGPDFRHQHFLHRVSGRR